jgi:hypothetical protein
MPPPGLLPLAHPISYLKPPSRTLAGNSHRITFDLELHNNRKSREALYNQELHKAL